MAINLTDALNAATTKGKLADAKQIYLEGDNKNLQDAHKDNEDHLNTLDTRSTQIEESLKTIAATGGASNANAVIYDNKVSGLTAINVKGALDELDEADTEIKSDLVKETARAKAAEEAIIYDVSAHNSGVVFESLQALLSSSNLSTLIPTSVRHGGMIIQFIQGSVSSSNNKYVQYHYIGTIVTGNPNPFLNTDNWTSGDAKFATGEKVSNTGIDNVPTVGSNNLITSNAVALVSDGNGWVKQEGISYTERKYINANGVIASYSSVKITNYINIYGLDKIKITASKPFYGNSAAFYDENKTFINGGIISARVLNNTIIEVPSGAYYIVIASNNDSKETILKIPTNFIENNLYYNRNIQFDIIGINIGRKDISPMLNRLYGSINKNTGEETIIYAYDGISSSNGWCITGKIPTDNISSLKFSTYLPTANIALWATYNADNQVIRLKKVDTEGFYEGIIDIADDEKYVCIDSYDIFRMSENDRSKLSLIVNKKDATKPIFTGSQYDMASWSVGKNVKEFNSTVSIDDDGYINLDGKSNIAIRGLHTTRTYYSFWLKVDNTSVVTLKLHDQAVILNMVSYTFNNEEIPEGFIKNNSCCIVVDGRGSKTNIKLINDAGEVLEIDNVDSVGKNFTSTISVTGMCRLKEYLSRVPKIDALFYGDSQTCSALNGGKTTQILYEEYTGKVMAWNAQGSTNFKAMLEDMNFLLRCKPKFIVFTFGTNGGNTQIQADELYKAYYVNIAILQSFGIKVIVNHIPNNKAFNNAAVQNAAIEKIVNDICIVKESGRYDLATSVNGDLSQGCNISVMPDGLHPNAEGHLRQFHRLMTDVPSLFSI